jgi:hypothetical protein
MRPHPIAYPVRNEDHSFAIKVTSSVKCGSDFPFKDIILLPCRHAFHPWCVIMHFSESNYCPYEACKAMSTHEWCKSFGIREVTLSICLNVEQIEEFSCFLKDVLGKLF